MPAFALLPPTSFTAEQPDMVAALQENAKGLTSHLDIYLTLREVMAMGTKEPLVETTRGESLLNNNIFTTSQVCLESPCSILLRGGIVQGQGFLLRSFSISDESVAHVEKIWTPGMLAVYPCPLS